MMYEIVKFYVNIFNVQKPYWLPIYEQLNSPNHVNTKQISYSIFCRKQSNIRVNNASNIFYSFTIYAEQIKAEKFLT